MLLIQKQHTVCAIPVVISHEHVESFLASWTVVKIVDSLDFSIYNTYMASYLRARILLDFFAFPPGLNTQ